MKYITLIIISLILLTGCPRNTRDVYYPDYMYDKVETPSDVYMYNDTTCDDALVISAETYDAEIIIEYDIAYLTDEVDCYELIEEEYLPEEITYELSQYVICDHEENLAVMLTYFDPLDILVLPHHGRFGWVDAHYTRFYPFGEIVDDNSRASFVYFIPRGFRVEQSDNLLRITPGQLLAPEGTSAFLEITQIPNTAVEEMELEVLLSIEDTDYRLFDRWHRQGTIFLDLWILTGLNRNDSGKHILLANNEVGGVFVITVRHAAGEQNYISDLIWTLPTFQIINGYDLFPLDIVVGTIQYLFDPMFMIKHIERMPTVVKAYPFGEVHNQRSSGLANYVIYVDTRFNVVQTENVLRIESRWDPHYMYMEITQFPNITVYDKVYRISSDTPFDVCSWCSSGGIPFDDVLFASLCFHEDHMVNYINRMTIKDNTQGGVFIISEQYPLEAAGGFGHRLTYILMTMKIIE